MSRRIGEHIRSNVVGYVALFFALSMGGAWAAGLQPNSVKSKQIKPGAVKSSDLAPNSVDSQKVVDDSLTGADVDEASLDQGALPQGTKGDTGAQGPAGEDGAQGPPGQNGSPDTPAQVLSKLVQVDGAASGLDADFLDGLNGAAFVADADSAGGDLGGTFSNLQIQANAVGAGEIANPTRSVNLPIGGFQVTEGAGGPIDFTPSDGTAPDYVILNQELVIEWDDNSSGGSDDDEVGSTFTVPPDYASGGHFVMRISKDANTGTHESTLCRVNVNNATDPNDQPADTDGFVINTASLGTYTSTPLATYAPGDAVGFECGTFGAPGDDIRYLHSMEWRYTATS